MDWISESIILNFRIRIGCGVHEKISDPIQLQNFHIRTPLRPILNWSSVMKTPRCFQTFLPSSSHPTVNVNQVAEQQYRV